MLHIEQPVGRLVIVRAASPLTLEEVDAFATEAMEVLCSGGPKIVCTDVRGLRVLPSEYAQRLAALMQLDLPCLERSAFLLAPDRALLELQFDRLVSECGVPTRRLFCDPRLLATWLAPALTPMERDALAAQMTDDRCRMSDGTAGAPYRTFLAC